MTEVMEKNILSYNPSMFGMAGTLSLKIKSQKMDVRSNELQSFKKHNYLIKIISSAVSSQHTSASARKLNIPYTTDSCN